MKNKYKIIVAIAAFLLMLCLTRIYMLDQKEKQLEKEIRKHEQLQRLIK